MDFRQQTLHLHRTTKKNTLKRYKTLAINEVGKKRYADLWNELTLLVSPIINPLTILFPKSF